MIYHGRNPDADGNLVTDSIKNHWLDMETKWFELKKACDCGKSLNSKFKCVKYSGSTTTQYGSVYFGEVTTESFSGWQKLIADKKIIQEEKEIIVATTKNEGKLDSVQSYDSEILSVGAIQKTVNSSRKGEFPKQVNKFKSKFPDKYEILFKECGWSVEENEMIYSDKPENSEKQLSRKKIKGKIREEFDISSYKKKLKCKPLEPIVKAAKDEDFQVIQIQDIKGRLVKVLKLKPSGYSYSISNYLKSKSGKAVALDHHINRPAFVDNDFGKALDNFFATQDKDKPEGEHRSKLSRNPKDWSSNDHAIYETEILDDYGKNRRMSSRNGKSVAPERYNHLKSEL